jgi:hypothetical protein
MNVTKTGSLKKSTSCETLQKTATVPVVHKCCTQDARRKSINKSHSSDVLLVNTVNTFNKIKSTSYDSLESLSPNESLSSKNEAFDSLIIDKLELNKNMFDCKKILNDEQIKNVINFMKVNSPGVIYDVYSNHESLIRTPEELAHILKEHLTESIISGIVTHLFHQI